MKQVVQSAAGGPVRVLDVPRPVNSSTEVLVRTIASLMSPGTERAVTALAQSNLLAKARARPDLVRQVVKKARNEGVLQAARAVSTRLHDDIPLGYSAAGIAIEVGEAVAGIAPGQLVATGGAGKANHAEFQAVPGLLCAAVPDGVPASDAAFATIASVALHGFRLAEVGPGAKVVVLGLGLVGQLGVRLAQAAGCDVAAIDVGEAAVERARAVGALGLVEAGVDTTKAIEEWSRGRGADAVLVMAATKSSSVIARTPGLCRDAANVVVVGDVGLELDRRPFYERELTLRFARSYGPGRYERSYEDWGVDFPPGLVRWSEGRNMEAVLDLLASGRLEVDDLVTHSFAIADAPDAYALVEKSEEPYVGIAFTYPGGELAVEKPIVLRSPRPRTTGSLGVGLIGAGAFASTVLMPAFKEAGFDRFVSVASASGLSARRLAERAGFERAVSGADAVIDDPEVDVVVIATPHDSHAELAARALRARKHVFCEKPLALTMEELDDVDAARKESGQILFVGFNRRYSEAVARVREHFAAGAGPLLITYRVNAGPVPDGHWYHDRQMGGRLLGEVCHFIDTCAAIVDEDATEVQALMADCPPAGVGIVVLLRYPEGSLATISYSSEGGQSVEKERVDVLGHSHTATVSDFRGMVIDRQHLQIKETDKGHAAQVQAFRRAIDAGTSRDPLAAIRSMRSTLLAASHSHRTATPSNSV